MNVRATKMIEGRAVEAWKAFKGRVTHADIQQHGSYQAARRALDAQTWAERKALEGEK